MGFDINSQLEKVFDLVLKYSKLKKGELIENHLDRIRILEINDLNFVNNRNVYFSRRSIKHFVERRLEEFLVKHDFEKSLEIMRNIIFSLPKVFLNHDNVFLDKDDKDIIFEKRSEYNNFNIRIVVENSLDGLHIKTIHPRQLKSLQKNVNKKSHMK